MTDYHYVKSEEIEEKLISACLQRADILGVAMDKLSDQSFTKHGHPSIWALIEKQYNAGHPVNADTVAQSATNKTLKQYIYLLSEMPQLGDAQEIEQAWVNKLSENQQKRDALWALHEALEQAQEEDSSFDAITQQVTDFFYRVQSNTQTNGPTLSGWQEALDDIAAAMERGGIAGISTGLPSLDSVIGGLCATDMIVLAGRPSMGKTSLAISIAEAVTQAGENVMFSSLEMSRSQINKKRLSILSGVSGEKLRNGTLSPDEYKHLLTIKDNQHFYVDEQAGVTPQQIRFRAKQLKATKGLGLLIVDYMQLMRSGDQRQSTVERTTEISKTLKEIAKELKVPVVALSQLSRAVEQREDKRPVLSDLRDSGSIEQDADSVLFCYRDEYYLERSEPQKFDREQEDVFVNRLASYHEQMQAARGKADVIVAKNRHGTIGSVKLKFVNDTQQFRELEDV